MLGRSHRFHDVASIVWVIVTVERDESTIPLMRRKERFTRRRLDGFQFPVIALQNSIVFLKEFSIRFKLKSAGGLPFADSIGRRARSIANGTCG